MLRLSKRYSNLYTANVFKLNKCALKIQHWYFRSKKSQQNDVKGPALEGGLATLDLAIEEEKNEVPEPIVI